MHAIAMMDGKDLLAILELAPMVNSPIYTYTYIHVMIFIVNACMHTYMRT